LLILFSWQEWPNMILTRRRAFTLIELIVVVVIIALVLALIFAALPSSGGREPARRTQCKSNLKQLGLAMHNYHDAWKCFPPGLVDDDDDPTEALHTGFLLLLPFVEETALFNAYNFKAEAPLGAGGGIAPDAAGARGASLQGWANPANSTVIAKQLNQYFCPTNRSEGQVELGGNGWLAGATDYAMASGAIPLLCSNRIENDEVARLRGVFGPNSHVRIKDMRDGTSLTVAMGEVAGGPHMTGTANVAARSASVRDAFGANRTDPKPWGIDQGWAMARIDGTRSGWPRGSIFLSAFQHVGSDLSLDGTPDELPAAMNPRLVMISRTGPRPGDLPCGSRDDRLSPARSHHTGGAQFLMGDGTVRYISENVDLAVYAPIFTIAGKETVDEDDF
jgi:prepilin-type N-terminal cleavage/methylation domain-containing protein